MEHFIKRMRETLFLDSEAPRHLILIQELQIFGWQESYLFKMLSPNLLLFNLYVNKLNALVLKILLIMYRHLDGLLHQLSSLSQSNSIRKRIFSINETYKNSSHLKLELYTVYKIVKIYYLLKWWYGC